MIVRGITADGEAVYLEVEFHTLARRVILHVQTRGHRWMAVALDLAGTQGLISALSLQQGELLRWSRTPVSKTDHDAAWEVVRGLRDAGIYPPELPPADPEEPDVLALPPDDDG
jgi:hypothetical protein